MDIDYQVVGSITLVPVYWQNPPTLTVYCDRHCLYSGPLVEETELKFDHVLSTGDHELRVEYFGKTDSDSQPEQKLDQAVVIKQLEFFGIADEQFLHHGLYQPCYPEPWASQQRDCGTILLPDLQSVRYLGWNGTWCLRFSVPIFTWMHKVLHLGHIYGTKRQN